VGDALLRFGIFLSYQRIHTPEHYHGDLFAEKLREAIEADRLGYEIIWIPEHHLIHFMQVPSVPVLATQIGLNVRCKIGTMVALLTYRHPLISAGELALVDQVLHGRLELGVGRGAYEYEFERLGVPFSEGNDRFREALDTLEQVWHNEDRAISYQGRFHSFDETYVWPRPAQRPHPPMWYAAMSPPSVDWAVRHGYHVANWPFLRDMSSVANVAKIFHAGREATGGVRGQQRLGILRGAFCAPTEAEAASHIEEALINHRINQRLHFFTQNADRRAVVAPDPVEDEPTNEQIYENLIMGTPEQCLEKIERYDELGVDDILLMFDYGPSHKAVMDTLRLFAEEVMEPYRAARHFDTSELALER
jgi:alkanesulfonate monooxygenase SsuD/methylene tetrahydromethanopterin reductase-like flavin-dependent oxidoreductase (luciferase family)